MTNKEKQLLFEDLCARLPYGVICHYDCVIPVGNRSLDKANAKDKLKGIIPMPGGHIGFMVGIDRVDALEGDIKPYLRPMSSMTEEEEREYNEALKPLGDFMFEQEEEFKPIQLYKNVPFELYEFFNSHHFDYHGLIEKGLALEAPEGMY